MTVGGLTAPPSLDASLALDTLPRSSDGCCGWRSAWCNAYFDIDADAIVGAALDLIQS